MASYSCLNGWLKTHCFPNRKGVYLLSLIILAEWWGFLRSWAWGVRWDRACPVSTGAVAFEADKRAGLQRMTATAGRGAPVVDSFCSIRLVWFMLVTTLLLVSSQTSTGLVSDEYRSRLRRVQVSSQTSTGLVSDEYNFVWHAIDKRF